MLKIKDDVDLKKLEKYSNEVKTIAENSTCLSRKVGCLILDKEFKRLSIGYNGAPMRSFSCKALGVCARKMSHPNCKSGEFLDECRAVHAEENAILHLKNNIDKAYYLIVSAVPCDRCAKLICNTNIRYVIALEDYNNIKSKAIFDENGVELIILNK